MSVLVHYDAMAKESDTILTDLSGNSRHGTYVNAALFDNNVIFDDHFYLNDDIYIDLGFDVLALCPSGVSVSITCGVYGQAPYQPFFSFDNDDGSQAYEWKFAKANSWDNRIYATCTPATTAGRETVVSNTEVVTVGKYQTFTATHDFGTQGMALYSDAVLHGSGTCMAPVVVARAWNSIGRDGNACNFAWLRANIKNVVVCNHVLSTEEIAIICRAGTPDAYYYTGVVTYGGVPQAWEVFLLDLDYNIVDRTTSDPDNGGAYTLYTPFSKEHTIMLRNPLTGYDHSIKSKKMPDGRLTSGV